MNKKIMKLKNLYTGEIVFTEKNSKDKTQKIEDVDYVEVYKEDNPERKFWVNRKFFEPVGR